MGDSPACNTDCTIVTALGTHCVNFADVLLSFVLIPEIRGFVKNQ